MFERREFLCWCNDSVTLFVYHRSMFEHLNHKKYNFSVASRKTVVMSRAAFHGECDGLSASLSPLAALPRWVFVCHRCHCARTLREWRLQRRWRDVLHNLSCRVRVPVRAWTPVTVRQRHVLGSRCTCVHPVCGWPSLSWSHRGLHCPLWLWVLQCDRPSCLHTLSRRENVSPEPRGRVRRRQQSRLRSGDVCRCRQQRRCVHYLRCRMGLSAYDI
jgi:hypothetical protein